MLIGDLSGSVLWPLVAHEIAPRCRSLVSSIAPGGGLVASRQTFVHRCSATAATACACAAACSQRLGGLYRGRSSEGCAQPATMAATNKCLAQSNKPRTREVRSAAPGSAQRWLFAILAAEPESASTGSGFALCGFQEGYSLLGSSAGLT